METGVSGTALETLAVGSDLGPLTKTITQASIDRYAAASGDSNPIHVDAEFARNGPFKGTIAHGLTGVAFISEMMMARFSQAWLTGGRLEVRFRAPIRPGDTIIVRGKVAEVRAGEHADTVICDVLCEDRTRTAVIVATACVRLNRTDDRGR
jgi:3-hydroxybutyryl-CoA dehydratase